MSLQACSLPIVPGPCEGYYQKFGYNKETGSCEQFKYGGCLGKTAVLWCAQLCTFAQRVLTYIYIYLYISPFEKVGDEIKRWKGGGVRFFTRKRGVSTMVII